MKKHVHLSQLVLALLLSVFLMPNLFAQDPFPCATQTNPEDMLYLQQTRNLRLNLMQDTIAFFMRPAADDVLHFPVMHHVLRRSDGTGGPSIATIENAMERLNDFYAEGNIQFYSCQSVQYINSDDLFEVTVSEGNDLANEEDDPEMFNIYYFESITMQGSSNWCGVRPGGGGDRIYMVNSCLDGWTLIHELGHYFSLAHTHGPFNCPNPADQITNELVNGSNCADAGDGICDTPADPNMGCGRGWVNGDCEYTGDAVDANGQEFNPLTNNVMSYGNSDCREGFTDEQWVAVRLSALNSRSHLLCNPCEGSDLLIGDLPAATNETFRALDDIIAFGEIETGARVTMIARDRIVWQPGFRFAAGVGSVVEGYINVCTIPAETEVVVP